jgi:hypothetical protein
VPLCNRGHRLSGGASGSCLRRGRYTPFVGRRSQATKATRRFAMSKYSPSWLAAEGQRRARSDDAGDREQHRQHGELKRACPYRPRSVARGRRAIPDALESRAKSSLTRGGPSCRFCDVAWREGRSAPRRASLASSRREYARGQPGWGAERFRLGDGALGVRMREELMAYSCLVEHATKVLHWHLNPRSPP